MEKHCWLDVCISTNDQDNSAQTWPQPISVVLQMGLPLPRVCLLVLLSIKKITSTICILIYISTFYFQNISYRMKVAICDVCVCRLKEKFWEPIISFILVSWGGTYVNNFEDKTFSMLSHFTSPNLCIFSVKSLLR